MKIVLKGLILGLLLCCPNYGNAQLTQRNLFKPFTTDYIKEVLISPEKWHPFPTTVAEWHKVLPDSIINRYIANGESSLQQDFSAVTATEYLQFTRSKDSPQVNPRYPARRFQLFNLIMAESMEGKGRFNDKIADAVWAICEESTWVIPAHISGLPNVDKPYVDLFAAETASLLAWTYYFVGDRLDQVSKQIKPRIVNEINRRMLNPIPKADWSWIGNDNPNRMLNNWSPWIMSNYITVNLLLETDGAKRAAAIKQGMNTIDHYLNGLGNDGAINEGPIYWFPSVGCVFDALNVLYSASDGKIDLFKDPFLKKSASYIYKMNIAGKYFVNMGDASVKMEIDGAALYVIGKSINDSNLLALGSNAVKDPLSKSNKPTDRMHTRRLFGLMEIGNALQYQGKYTVPQDAWMSDIQMMCSHAKNGFFVSAHGGHNGESHNHNDVGDFTVYFNGKPLILDAGRGSYTGRTFSAERYNLWFNTSGYHNLPEINGIQQKDGSKYAAKNVSYSADAKRSSLTMDIAGAYPEQAGVKSWERIVSLYKKGWVEINDRYALATAVPVTQHFMTVCKTDINTPGVIVFTMPDQKKVKLLYDASVWQIEKHSVELNQPEDRELRVAWEDQTIERFSLITKKTLQEGVTTYRILEAE